MGVSERDFGLTKFYIEDVACYEQYTSIAYGTEHHVHVMNNLCQGSRGQGFVFPAIPCEFLSASPFADNTAGSCEIAFMYEDVYYGSCLGATKIAAYASKVGFMANFYSSGLTKIIY